MRIYTDESRNQLAGVICNQCKKELSVENGIIKEGCFSGNINLDFSAVKTERSILLICARNVMIK